MTQQFLFILKWWLAFACMTSVGSVLQCWQCHPMDSITSDSGTVRITMNLPRATCYRHVLVKCEREDDICTKQVTRTDQGFWIAMGCSPRYLYDEMGCSRTMTHQKIQTGGTSAAALTMNNVRKSSIEMEVCVCEESRCNSAISTRAGQASFTAYVCFGSAFVTILFMIN